MMLINNEHTTIFKVCCYIFQVMNSRDDSSSGANSHASGGYEVIRAALDDRIDYWQAYKSKLESGIADPERPVDEELEAVEDEIGVGLMLYELAEQAEENPGAINPDALQYVTQQYLETE